MGASFWECVEYGDAPASLGQHRPAPTIPDATALLELLSDVLGDELMLADVAARSYRHQLGFEKYVLQVLPNGACIRMHHWDRAIDAEEDIHSHCASFSSRILLGELTQQTFELAPGRSHAVFNYRFNSETGESQAWANGATSVAERATRSLYAGQSYDLAATELHRVTGAIPGTVSLSCWEPRLLDAIVLKPISSVEVAPSCARAGMGTLAVRGRLHEIYLRLLSA